jgi:RNA polymerase sigma-70 factor (ECF subfamily)
MPHLVPNPRPASLEEISDRDLMASVIDGDEVAFEELMDRKTRPLLGLAHRMVGDREEAKDLVQLTFLRVWEHRSRYDGRFSVNTWIYRITSNLAIDLLRSRQVRGNQAEPVRHHMIRLVSRRSDLESLFQREVMGILRDLAAGLSEKQRLAFLLREVEGLSSKEVAEILECGESTVRNHLFVARKYLRREVCRRFPEYASELRAAAGVAS